MKRIKEIRKKLYSPSLLKGHMLLLKIALKTILETNIRSCGLMEKRMRIRN
jgi:hypothetical protein